VISSGVVEGFSGKAKLTARKAYGLRTPQGIAIAIFHPMGYDLPSRHYPADSAEEAFSEGSFSQWEKGHQNCKSGG